MADGDYSPAWCVLSDHWGPDGSHNPPAGGTLADPVWLGTCNVRSVLVPAGAILGIDDTARNGQSLVAICEGRDMVIT